jgi:hypothetical protein
MTDVTTQAMQTGAVANGAEPITAVLQPKTFSEDYVKELREENKSWRLKMQEISNQLNEYQTKEKQTQEQEQIKRGEFEKLLSQKESDLLAMRKELESLKPIAEEYSKIKLTRKEELIAKLPEHVREDFKSASFEEIERAIKLLPSAPAQASAGIEPVLDASQTQDITKLTQEQLDQIRVNNPARFSEIIKQLFK